MAGSRTQKIATIESRDRSIERHYLAMRIMENRLAWKNMVEKSDDFLAIFVDGGADSVACRPNSAKLPTSQSSWPQTRGIIAPKTLLLCSRKLPKNKILEVRDK
jgi:hypothetical protein